MADFLDWDAVVLVQALRKGELSAQAVMAATLARIKACNGAVNAIVDLRFEVELMAEAEAADAVAVAARGALHGLPMAVKDLADVAGLRSSAGSPVYADRVAQADSHFVRLMRAEGAIFIGKTNVPEFGLGSHSYNPVHGVTRNPYGVERSAGGSSGGAAVALACGMVALADGSDMMGSLRNPAGWNNVYGFRPSWGVVPREAGQESFWQQLSSIGPMARSPRDMALLLTVMAQSEARVPHNVSLPEAGLPSRCSVEGRRIGWLGDWGGAMPMQAGVLAQCEQGLAVLNDLGARVEAVAPPFEAEAMFRAWADLRSFALAGELADLYDDPHTRARLKPEAVWEVARGLAMPARDLMRATQVRSAWFTRAAELFEQFDALVLPVAQCWPFPVDLDWPKEINGTAMDSYHRWMQVVVPASLIGIPAVSVPVGFGGEYSGSGAKLGLPMGMQIIGTKGADLEVLAMAQAYHEATLWPQKYPAGAVSA